MQWDVLLLQECFKNLEVVNVEDLEQFTQRDLSGGLRCRAIVKADSGTSRLVAVNLGLCLTTIPAHLLYRSRTLGEVKTVLADQVRAAEMVVEETTGNPEEVRLTMVVEKTHRKGLPMREHSCITFEDLLVLSDPVHHGGWVRWCAVAPGSWRLRGSGFWEMAWTWMRQAFETQAGCLMPRRWYRQRLCPRRRRIRRLNCEATESRDCLMKQSVVLRAPKAWAEWLVQSRIMWQVCVWTEWVQRRLAGTLDARTVFNACPDFVWRAGTPLDTFVVLFSVTVQSCCGSFT